MSSSYSFTARTSSHARRQRSDPTYYQLLHILPHELGHHHDRMTIRARRHAGRGEPYANRVLERVWPVYARAFGV